MRPISGSCTASSAATALAGALVYSCDRPPAAAPADVRRLLRGACRSSTSRWRRFRRCPSRSSPSPSVGLAAGPAEPADLHHRGRERPDAAARTRVRCRPGRRLGVDPARDPRRRRAGGGDRRRRDFPRDRRQLRALVAYGFVNPRSGRWTREGRDLVEGISDQRALEALATRRGRDLEAEACRSCRSAARTRSAPPSSGSATRAGREARRPLRRGRGACIQRGLERAGLGTDLHTRGHGGARFLRLRQRPRARARAGARRRRSRADHRAGKASSDDSRTFQKQVAKREPRPWSEQLWRFMWNRKIRYAPLLVEALDLDQRASPARRRPRRRLRAQSRMTESRYSCGRRSVRRRPRSIAPRSR